MKKTRILFIFTFSFLVSLQIAYADKAGSLAIDAYIAQPSLQSTESTTVTLVVKNDGKVPVDSIEIRFILPDGWTVQPKAVGSKSLQSNETGIATFVLEVPRRAEPGKYNLVVTVDSSAPTGHKGLSVEVIEASIPTSGSIPISIAVNLIPGFIAYSIMLVLAGLKIEGRSALEIILISFLLGASIWYLSPFPLGLPSTRNPLVIGLPTFEDSLAAAILSFTIGGSLGLTLRAVKWSKDLLIVVVHKLLENWWQKFRIQKRGFATTRESAWFDLLESSFEQMKPGYAIKIVATTSQHFSNKEPMISGLLAGADQEPPYDLVLQPQLIYHLDSRKKLEPFFPEDKLKGVITLQEFKKKFLEAKLDENMDEIVKSLDIEPVRKAYLKEMVIIKGEDIRRLKRGSLQPIRKILLKEDSEEVTLP